MPKMKQVQAAWFRDDTASYLQTLRQRAREKRRITYDCCNAIVNGCYVICGKGHPIGREPGGLMLLTVLRGRSSSQCKNCPDYDAADEFEY